MKKLIALLLAMMMVFSLVACGGSSDEGTTDEKQEDTKIEVDVLEDKKDEPEGEQKDEVTFDKPTKITVGLANSFSTLDPFIGTGLYYNYVTNEVYQRLGFRNSFDENTLEGMLMKEWSYEGGNNEDGHKWHIVLHEGIYDSEGNTVNANDVKFCLDQAVTDARSRYRYIHHVEVINDNELYLYLNNNDLGTFDQVCENFGIVSEKAWKASPDGMATQGQVATGPYVIKEFIAGSRIVLEKNDNYWAAGREDLNWSALFDQTFDVIQFDFVTEPNQMQSALETGTIQAGMWVDATINAGCKEIDGYKVLDLESPQLCVMVFNCYDGPCANEDFRKAVAYGVNEEIIIENVLYGVGEPAEYLGMSSCIGTNEAWAEQYDNYAYDMDKAMEYLEKSGYNGEVVEIGIRANTLFRNCSQMLQAQLAAMGINSNITEYDGAVVDTSTTATNPDTQCDITWKFLSRGGSYLIQTAQSWLSNKNYADGHTFGGIKSDELQAVVDRCLSEDWTQEDYDELQRLVQEHCYLWQWYRNYFSVAVEDNIELTSYNRSAANGEINWGSVEVPADWTHFAE